MPHYSGAMKSVNRSEPYRYHTSPNHNNFQHVCRYALNTFSFEKNKDKLVFMIWLFASGRAHYFLSSAKLSFIKSEISKKSTDHFSRKPVCLPALQNLPFERHSPTGRLQRIRGMKAALLRVKCSEHRRPA